MKKYILTTIITIAWLLQFCIYAQASSVKVIFDQDEGSDPDCTGFILKLAELGECDIIAMGAYYTGIFSPRALESAAKYYNLTSIPIGVNKTTSDTSCGGLGSCDWFGSYVATYFSITTASYPDVVTVYRTALVAQADHSVTIIAMGPIKNLWNLYNSPADGISALTGAELIAHKVKEIFTEGLDYPTYSGFDYNFYTDAPVAKNFIDAMTAINMRMVYSGNYTAGALVNTNTTTAPENSYSYQSYCHLPEPLNCGRPAWGHIDVLYALRGTTWNGTQYLTVSTEGKAILNTACDTLSWTTGAYNQFYLNLNVDHAVLEPIVNDIQNAAVGASLIYPLIPSTRTLTNISTHGGVGFR